MFTLFIGNRLRYTLALFHHTWPLLTVIIELLKSRNSIFANLIWTLDSGAKSEAIELLLKLSSISLSMVWPGVDFCLFMEKRPLSLLSSAHLDTQVFLHLQIKTLRFYWVRLGDQNEQSHKFYLFLTNLAVWILNVIKHKHTIDHTCFGQVFISWSNCHKNPWNCM